MAKKAPASKAQAGPATKKRAARRAAKGAPGSSSSAKRAEVAESSESAGPTHSGDEGFASPRIRRPPLPRSEPIRSWSTLFGSPREGSAAGSAPFGIPGLPNIPGTAGGGVNGAAGVGPEAVRRGVEMGYRVVDEYMKQGASVANAFSNAGRARSASGTAPGVEPDLSKMTERMMQYASDFTSLWYDAMGMMMGTMSQQARPDASKRANGEAPAARSSALLGHSRIILELKSALTAEVILALDEPACGGALTVEDLKARTGSATIAGALVEPAPDAQGPLRVRVHVAAKVPPGRYTGAILDAASGKPKGRLTVTLSK